MFASREDMEDAVKVVDGSEMKNMRGVCTLRVDFLDGPTRSGGDRRVDHDRGREPERDINPDDRRERTRCAPCRIALKVSRSCNCISG
jgi:hypothetical protein